MVVRLLFPLADICGVTVPEPKFLLKEEWLMQLEKTCIYYSEFKNEILETAAEAEGKNTRMLLYFFGSRLYHLLNDLR